MPTFKIIRFPCPTIDKHALVVDILILHELLGGLRGEFLISITNSHNSLVICLYHFTSYLSSLSTEPCDG